MDKFEIAIITDVTLGKCYDHRTEKVELVIYSKFAASELNYVIYDADILEFITKNKIENLTDIVGRPIIYRQDKNFQWFFEKFFDE